MNIEIVHGPGNAAAKVTLGPGEEVTGEAGAMIAMSSDMSVETTTHSRGGKGGLLKGLKRMLGGESFFINHFRAGGSGGEVIFAANLSGDMMEYEFSGDSLVVQGNSWVCSSPQVEVDTKWSGFKSFFGGENLFMLNLSGSGKAVLSSFGAIYPIAVDGAYIVDTGHIVAFESSLSYTLEKAGGHMLSAILGGEGLVCRFQGQGTVWCQSHNPTGFGQALGPMLRPV